MKNDVLIWILIASVLVFAIGITSIDFANGQSVATTIGTSSTAYNGTQYIPVYLPPATGPKSSGSSATIRY